MKSVIRERILEQLSAIPALVDAYHQKHSGFSDNCIDWLRRAEQALASFRLPLTSQLAGLRGAMVAATDGLSEPDSGAKRSRKLRSAQVMLLLQQAEEVLRRHCDQIDQEFEEHKEKLSQLLAVASAKQPLPATDQINQAYLNRIWQQVKHTQDNSTLAHYITARLNDTDRSYLLVDIVSNLLNSAQNQ
ncbi:hypothetical protein [Bacterioplanoides sp.]|uniref:hypothetical protein n=1 Tax=Bacterioplanoides sp. TaxID=2066072 RepID=UPI003AFFF347